MFCLSVNAMDFYKKLQSVISGMPQTGLEETEKVGLTNHTDRKYLANKSLLLRFLELIKDEYSVLAVSESPVSVYSTTYWDTDDHRFYIHHHDERRPCIKVRVKTYIDADTTFLEVESKDNHDKTCKSRVRLASPEEMNSDDEEMFLEEKAEVSPGDIHPCLENRFSRIILVDRAFTERLTIDFDVSFSNLETRRQAELGDIVIMELKRSIKTNSPALDAIKKLRIKPQGFSKYCVGTYLTNPGVKYNKFKKKEVELKRLR